LRSNSGFTDKFNMSQMNPKEVFHNTAYSVHYLTLTLIYRPDFTMFKYCI